MSARRTARGSVSAEWAVARLCGELAAFVALLFLTRFVARGYLAPQSDQECHIGGIAVDVLAHGIRFPLLVYAPNEYDNGSFFSGLLAAVSFSLFGRSVLALKLVTHVISAAGAVATLWLLRACLKELGLTGRRTRWIATIVLVLAIALAPTVVTALSMYAVGNHAEGIAIDAILLALFAYRKDARPVRIAAFWALVGFALYLNKGTVLVIPVLGAAEIVLAGRARGRLTALMAGFLLGVSPELWVIAQRRGIGWATMAVKTERTSHAFPWAFVDEILTLAEHRIELLAVWVLAAAVGVSLLMQSARRYRGEEPPARHGVATRPVALGLVLGVALVHLVALAVMAQGGFDAYVIYGYPSLVVLYALTVAVAEGRISASWGPTAATWASVAAIALTVVLYRPQALAWGMASVDALWRNRAGAACSWRFAEGFEREYQYGLAPPGRTREQHTIERCRSLSETAEVLDCIGGIARELRWREDGRVQNEPPAELTDLERRAYAYYYGTHAKGDATPCRDFADPGLTATCAAAVQLECLIFRDQLTGIATGQRLGRPHCTILEPPMDGYWAQMRLNLLARTDRTERSATQGGEGELRGCRRVFDECY